MKTGTKVFIGILGFIAFVLVVSTINTALYDQQKAAETVAITPMLVENVSTPTPSPAPSAASQVTDIVSTSSFPMMPLQEYKISCPICGSFNNIINKEEDFTGKYLYDFKCLNCGNVWSELFSTPVKGIPYTV